MAKNNYFKFTTLSIIEKTIKYTFEKNFRKIKNEVIILKLKIKYKIKYNVRR